MMSGRKKRATWGRALFCDDNWLFDLEFLVKVNDHVKSSEYQTAEQQ